MSWLCTRIVTALIVVMLWAAPAPARTDLPNIIVIVIDTLRADRVGVNGNRQGLTPFLDELAGRGTTFVNAYAPSSWTCPSVASLLTSRHASQHQVIGFDSVLAKDETTIAELLAAHGYTAAGFSANLRLSEHNGYAQGFGIWHSYIARAGEQKVRGSVLREATLAWLATLPPSDASPRLLYLQYMEPHAPYEPPEPYWSRFGRFGGPFSPPAANTRLVALGWGKKGLSAREIDGLMSLYDGEVAAVDAEIRTLFQDLEQRKLLDNAIVIVTSDHGEEFAEHDHLLHGFTLYQAVIRVPLIILAPGILEGKVVSDNVSLIDIAPTLMELLGLPPAASFEGRSLVPLMRAPEQAWWAWLTGTIATVASVSEADVLSELEPFDAKVDGRLHVSSLISGTHKLLVPRRGEPLLFDLAIDPGETRSASTASSTAPSPAALMRTLEQTQARLRARKVTATEALPLDDATKEKLRALGYHP